MQDSIGHRLEMLQAVAPKRSRHGQLYAFKEQTTRSYALIRMRVLMQAEDGHLRLHESLFNKKKGKTPPEWGAWMKQHFREVYTKSILAYMHKVEGVNWRVLKIVGWTGERLAHNGKRISNNSALAKRRNKTKRQRAKRGKNYLRRRHRNRKR